jgi:hypothetical protein
MIARVLHPAIFEQPVDSASKIVVSPKAFILTCSISQSVLQSQKTTEMQWSEPLEALHYGFFLLAEVGS